MANACCTVMKHALLTPLFLALCLAAFSHAQHPNETVLREVALKYFETLTRQDLEGHMALWTGLASELEARRARLQKLLAEQELSFSPPVISRVSHNQTLGSLHVRTERRARNRQTNQVTLNTQQLVFTLVKEDEWRIAQELPASSWLLGRLMTALEPEQSKLLETERDLVTPELLQLLVGQSDRQFASGNHARTLKTLRLVLQVAELLDDRGAQAGAWHHLGIAQFMSKQYAEALASHQKALALEQSLGRKSEQARVLASLALTYETLKQPKQALVHYQQALALYEALNERGEVAATLDTLGNFHYDQGDYHKALEQLQRSLSYLATTESQTFANRSLKAGRVAYELGNDALALQHYQRALTSFEKLNDHANRGYTLHTLANLFYAQGDLGRALLYYQQSLQAAEQAKSSSGMGSALQGIGLVHSLNGNFALALPAYDRNLSLSRTANDPAQLATALQKVAATRFSLGEYQTALELYSEALQVREASGDQFEIARALLDVGITHVSLSQFTEALAFEERSRALFAQLNQPAGLASALLSLALVHYLQQDFAQALAHADEAATFAKQAHDNELLWQARYRAGKCQQQLKQLPLARQALTEAVTLIETQRPAPGQTGRLGENKLGPYQALVDVLITLDQGSEAFHFAERAKARGLLATLRSGRVWITNTMSAVEQTREQRLLNELGLLAAQLAREREKQQPNQQRTQELSGRWRQTRAAYIESVATTDYCLLPTAYLT
jgi:tetratricopeptide (TPR) repeat protein